jgi:raffinose/stachyose/melibiose transport system permease protein
VTAMTQHSARTAPLTSSSGTAASQRATPAGVTIASFVVVVAVLQLIPFYVALTTSFKAKTDRSSQLSFPVSDLTTQNFLAAIEQGQVLRAMANSLLVSVVTTTLVCLLGAAAAYPLARRPTRFNRSLLGLNVGLMMIPALSVLVPLYSLLADLRAINTYWGIILVLTAGGLPLSIFLYSAFMRSLPISIEEAARIDGANLLKTLWYVVIPMLKPVSATVGIITGVGVWNEFALSGSILTSPETRTIAPAISSFFSISSSNLPAAAAASLLAVVPVVVAYVFGQKYFVRGLVGAEKG